MKFRTAPETQVKYPKLDIVDTGSIRAFVDTIKKDHGTVDVLINNAGVNLEDQYSPQSVKATLDTNVRGTLQVSIPIILILIYLPRSEVFFDFLHEL